MFKDFKYVIISPVRDEFQYVEKTINSIILQKILPLQWVIVDDGSTDGTDEILDRYSELSWIKVVHRANRGYRAAGSGVIEAFYEGYSALSVTDWDFVVKLDGDLSFNVDYFQKCLAHFGSEPGLGIAGGTVYVFENGKLKIDSAGDPPFHVRGATKIYRRACWDKISPLVRAPGWDTIDEVKANLHGWNTRTFSDLKLIQHKATGEAAGNWRNWFKNGRANYITGYHPLFMLAKCARRTFQKPLFVNSLALWAGFSTGYLKRIPQVQDVEVIRYLRQQQIRHLFLRPSIYG